MSMQWLSFVETVFVTPLCSTPPCTSWILTPWSPNFLGLHVIIKDRILVRFQLGKCFLLFKIYLSWKIWPISGENQCGFPAEMMSEKWVLKLLYILSVTIVFIWNCFHHPSPPNHPLHTSTFPLVSPERMANILQDHRWFPCEMNSEKWAQKFLFC